MPIDYSLPPDLQMAARRHPLPGSLNAQGYRTPEEVPPGLVIPGQTPPVPQAPQRPMGLGDIGRSLLGMAGDVASVPRQVAWNLGPALVGRSGQGPQTGAEALQRLGLDYNSPAQRAIGHGLGVGLDLVADPMNLVGMGAGGRAAGGVAASANPVTRRLTQLAGPGLEEARMAAQVRAARPIPIQPGSSLADAMRMMSTDRPALTGNPPGLLPRSAQAISEAGATIPGGGTFEGPGRTAAERAANQALIRGAPAAIAEARASGLTVPTPPPTSPFSGMGMGPFSPASPRSPWGGSLAPSTFETTGSPSFLHEIRGFSGTIPRPMPAGGFPDFPTQLDSARFLNPPAAASRLDRLAAAARNPLPQQLEAMAANPTIVPNTLPTLGDMWQQANPTSGLYELPNLHGGTLGPKSPTIPQPPPDIRYPWEHRPG